MVFLFFLKIKKYILKTNFIPKIKKVKNVRKTVVLFDGFRISALSVYITFFIFSLYSYIIKLIKS